MTIAEALETVELEPGRTYRCKVRGLDVELRVSPQQEKTLLSKPLCEEDIMLDAWCELPQPKTERKLRPKWGARFMPDIPDIPRDEVDAE